jgi:hypothetical protein
MIIPTAKSFIPEKLVSHDRNIVTVQGHYGAVINDGEVDIQFHWGNANKTYTKRKWEKKLRYLANKGLAVKLEQSVTLRNSRRI